MDAYTLKKNKGTGEFHLFKGTMNPEGDGCTSKNESICKEMLKEEQDGVNKFMCKDEKEARKLCAEIGRDVCGVCVSDLYLTKTK